MFCNLAGIAIVGRPEMGYVMARCTVERSRRTRTVGRFAALPCRLPTGTGLIGMAHGGRAAVSDIGDQLGRTRGFLAAEGDACG